MEPAKASGERETVATRLVASGCAIALCVAFFLAQQRDLMAFNGAYRNTQATVVLLTVMATIFAGLPWLASRYRAHALLASSAVVGALALGWLVPLPFLFTWVVVHVTRRPWRNSAKLGLLFTLWVAVSVVGWFAPNVHGLRFMSLATYWASMPGAMICLVVERGRGELDGVDIKEEWLYMLAMPRFVAPFVQPILASRFIRARRSAYTGRLALSALGLGLYAIAGFAVIKYTHYSVKTPTDVLSFTEHGPRVLRNLLRIYAYNATAIFCGVAILRLLGYELGSGFRYPLLARSPSDFYRRWNYYFFEFASSIVYLPVVSRCRRWLPLWLAYVVAGYASFIMGMWVLDRLVDVPMSRYAAELVAEVTNREELIGYGVAWTVVVWSQVLIAPLRRLRRFVWWRIAARTATLLVLVAGITVLFSLQITLY